MKYLKIIICFLFFPLTANGKADQDSIRLALKHMEDGLKTKEIAVAQKSFAPEFSISIYSLPFASGLLKQIMEGITFQSIQPDWKGMKTRKRHQSGGPFHIGRRTRREEHDSFQ